MNNSVSRSDSYELGEGDVGINHKNKKQKIVEQNQCKICAKTDFIMAVGRGDLDTCKSILSIHDFEFHNDLANEIFFKAKAKDRVDVVELIESYPGFKIDSKVANHALSNGIEKGDKKNVNYILSLPEFEINNELATSALLSAKADGFDDVVDIVKDYPGFKLDNQEASRAAYISISRRDEKSADFILNFPNFILDKKWGNEIFIISLIEGLDIASKIQYHTSFELDNEFANEVLADAITHGNGILVAGILSIEGFELDNHRANEAFYNAVFEGHDNTAQMILEYYKFELNEYFATMGLKDALKNGHENTSNLILNYSGYDIKEEDALEVYFYSISNGLSTTLETIKRNPKFKYNEQITKAGLMLAIHSNNTNTAIIATNDMIDNVVKTNETRLNNQNQLIDKLKNAVKKVQSTNDLEVSRTDGDSQLLIPEALERILKGEKINFDKTNFTDSHPSQILSCLQNRLEAIRTYNKMNIKDRDNIKLYSISQNRT